MLPQAESASNPQHRVNAVIDDDHSDELLLSQQLILTEFDESSSTGMITLSKSARN